MRLHHLEVTAFGPFADTVRVDFDDLSSAGLFLLTGPTGAGKTTVLDAVCFALYGDVPGGRALARRLRSDQAPAGRPPLVTLECTLGGRRLRIVRSPAWHRPKRRGSGTTLEQARVTLSERTSGQWQPVSTRIDEVGHLLGDLLGMSLTQFTQVAMLPQGEFQAFLRARADDRQALLEKLFRTERFRQVEQWLAERRRTTGRQVGQHEHELSRLLARAGEALEVDPPQGEAAGTPPAIEVLEAWLADQRADLAAAAEAADRDLDDAARMSREAAATLAAGRELAAHRARWRGASAARTALLARTDEVEAARTRVADARRAEPALPLLRLSEAAAQRADRCAAVADRAVERAQVRSGLDTLDEAGLETARTDAERRASDVRALLPLEDDLADLSRRARETAEMAGRLEERTSDLDKSIEALPVALADAEAWVVETARAAEEARAAEQETEELARRHRAAEQLVELTRESEQVAELRRDHVDSVQRAKDVWLGVREERIAGMAAEIAGGLVVGGSCPVCGSCEHPQPAVAGPDAPDATRERAARRAVDERARGLSTRVAVARQAAGEESREGLDRRLAQSRSRLGLLRETAGQVAAAEASRDRVRHELDTARAEVAQLRAERASLDSTSEAISAQRATLRARLAAVLDDQPQSTLRELAEHHAAVSAVCAEALEALRAARSADQDARARTDELSEALAAGGFDDAAQLTDAALPAADVQHLESRVRTHERELAAAEGVLADPLLAGAAEADEPDLDRLSATAAQAQQRLTLAEHRRHTLRRRAERLTDLAAGIGEVCATLAPLREEHALATSLAAFAEGRSPDNRLAMRLSAYALSYRLGQVVDAANERLGRMSDHRYQLEHSASRGAGDRRGGLALLVRDAWSGESRDPATLSGGETFIVSLSLALGLSDVVTHESAGAELGTLFVDEGFGSLDPDTLDHVLDTLDQLRSGGRVVGIVSHVAEVRARIPARLVVEKAQTGSTLTQVSTDA